MVKATGGSLARSAVRGGARHRAGASGARRETRWAVADTGSTVGAVRILAYNGLRELDVS